MPDRGNISIHDHALRYQELRHHQEGTPLAGGKGVAYRFHDVRADGLSQSDLQDWLQTLDWESLLNRRGTTWRRLPESARNHINKTSAVKIMLDNPAIIKRPVLAHRNKLYLGFSTDSYQSIFRTQASA